MIIKEVVTLAKHSELSGVAAKDSIDAIVAFINLGMLELYKRFPIRVEEHVVTLQEDVNYYDMPTDFMYALGAYGEKDESNPTMSTEIPINDEMDEDSVFFNDWSTLQVPSTVSGDFVAIIYATKPTSITTVQADDGTTELDLPDVLIDALLSYVGYRAYLGIRTDAQSENNAHWARFERNCKKAADLGVVCPPDSMSMATRLFNRGYV